MVTNTVLRERKQRIEGDIIIFEARLKAATQSLEISGLQARLDELKMQVASIDSILNAITKLNGFIKAKTEAIVRRDLSLVPVAIPTPAKKRVRRGRPIKRKLKEEGEAKHLFQA